MWRGAVGLIALALLAACGPAPAPRLDLRGQAFTLATAPQSEAPAFAAAGAGALAFWIGIDERGVHHDARRLTPDGMGEAVTLPLPPTDPHAQTAVPSGGGALLFWLDQPPDAPNQAALYAARITPGLEVARGPVALSAQPVYGYAAQPTANRGALAVWSGGPPDEPILFAREVDAEGRPLALAPLLADDLPLAGAEPTLTVDAGGQAWLFWMARGQVWRGRLLGPPYGPVADATALTAGLHLAAGDRLIRLRAGSDGAYGYVFWTVERASGDVETWLTVGSFNDPFWSQPRRFMLDGQAVTHAAPLDQAASPLPIAALHGGVLTIAHGRAGQVTTTLAAAEGAVMLRPPSLVAAGGGLWVGWAQVEPGAADLVALLLR